MENEQPLTPEPEVQKKQDKEDNHRRLALILLFLLFSFVCLLCSSQGALWFVDRDQILGHMRSAQQADYGLGAPIIFSRLDGNRLIEELFNDEQAIFAPSAIVAAPAIAQLPKVTPQSVPSPIPTLPTPTPQPTQTPTPAPASPSTPQSSAPTSPPQPAPTQPPSTQPPPTQPPPTQPPPTQPPPTAPPTTEPPPPPPPPPPPDDDGGSDPPSNTPPTAVNDAVTTTEDTAVNIAVLANDSDPDGDSLSIISVGTPANGTANIVGNSILYTPALNFVGVDTFSYTISDGSANASATVTVTVNPANDPPVAQDDTAATNEDTAVVITVLSNDSDPDGDPLSVISTNITTGTIVINAPPTYTVTYTPPLNFNGVITFGYTISDGSLTDSAVVTVTVGAVNDPPTTVDDAVATNQDTSVNISVLANDSDIDGTLVTNTLTISTPPISGTAVASTTTGIVTYTPNPGISGIDTFVYQICDNGAACNTATVTVTITDTTPTAPTNLQAAAGDMQISLGWIHNPPADLTGYNVYRSDGGPFTLISTTMVITRYVDQPLVNGTTYTYTVTAIDVGSNESGPSNTASATPGAIVTNTTTVTCSGNVVNCASAGGPPNTSIAEIMDSTGVITLDFGAGEGILDGPSWDMVFYEFYDGASSAVRMDYVTIELSTDGITWYTVLEWDGDTGAAVDVQGTSIDSVASDANGEFLDEAIPSNLLYPQFAGGTTDFGIAIDIGAVQDPPPGGQKYRYVRISYPPPPPLEISDRLLPWSV